MRVSSYICIQFFDALGSMKTDIWPVENCAIYLKSFFYETGEEESRVGRGISYWYYHKLFDVNISSVCLSLFCQHLIFVDVTF